MALSQRELDIQMMLAAKVHLGTKNCDFQMERYIHKRGADGIFIINLGKTWEKLQMAARIIVAIENPQDICVQSQRPYGQRAVLKFAHYTGAQAIAGRHTPGTFTNQLQTSFSEPRLLVLADPRVDHQPANEGALGNIPVIAFCDTDSPMKYVDVGIPANNKSKHSIGCLFYLLARMVLQMRGTIPPNQPWDVMVDLFFYREPEEAREQEEEGVLAVNEYATAGVVPDYTATAGLGVVQAIPEAEWDGQGPVPVPAGGDWDAVPAAAPPTAAAGEWTTDGGVPVATTGWETSPAPAPAGGWESAVPPNYQGGPPPPVPPPTGWDTTPPPAPGVPTGWST